MMIKPTIQFNIKNMNSPESPTHHLQKEIAALKRKSRLLQAILLLIVVYLLVSGWIGNRNKGRFERVTANEIVVRDSDGHDRIILSPQIVASQTRLRSDTLEGILILDRNGTDRVLLGATPTIQSEGTIMKRVDNSVPWGFAFNDSLGNERGGFGYYDSRGLVSFGMDNRSGEGLTMFVADGNLYGQKVGLVMQQENAGQAVYLGASQEGQTMLNLDAPGKGRISLSIDSMAGVSFNHYDNLKQTSRMLVKQE